MSDRSRELMSVRAVISYVQMLSFFVALGAVIWIIVWKVEVSPLMAGILGTILGTTSQAFSAVRSYWLPGAGADRPPAVPAPASDPA